MRRDLRRLLQVIAIVGTLFVGIVAVALIVSQTPWFKDWLRRYIVRESKQYLNGELSIGSLGGNLFFGVQLARRGGGRVRRAGGCGQGARTRLQRAAIDLDAASFSIRSS